MKKLLLIFFCLLLFESIAQIDKNNSSAIHLIGIQARLIDLMPFELSYIKLKKKGLSFAIRGGYGKGDKNKSETNTYRNYSVYRPTLFTYSQSFESYFIKPGIVFATNKSPIFRSIYLINYSIAKSYDKMIITADDPIFDSYIQTNKESHVYQSLEFEGNHQLNLFKEKIYFGFGYIFGVKTVNDVPFKSILKGIDEGSQYSPSQGIGKYIYINSNMSLMYKL